MTASRPDIEAIFHTARVIPDPDRRRDYVREACGGDEARVDLLYGHSYSLENTQGTSCFLFSSYAAISSLWLSVQPILSSP